MNRQTDLAGKKVLVTGAAGFIGSHLVQQLVRQGACVRAFVHYNSRNQRGFLAELGPDEWSQLSVFMGDLKDPHGVREAVRGCELVFHLGALIAIPYSYTHPADVVQTNVLGTLHVAQACQEADVERLIHTSTSEVYGTARYVPMDEKHPLQGQSPYAASKIAADKIVESFFCSYDLPVVTVRPFNAYGPRQSMRAVIPTLIQQALYYDVIRLGNLQAIRDFTYVKDTASAFIKAATADEAVLGEVFNAGSGQEISIRNLVEKVKKVVGREVAVEIDEERLRPTKSEVQRLVSDSRKAKEILCWEPQVSLEEGIGKTVDYIQNHKDVYKESGYVL